MYYPQMFTDMNAASMLQLIAVVKCLVQEPVKGGWQMRTAERKLRT